MSQRDERIDKYIAKAAPFAQPILTHLRELVHRACPEARETMKWSVPFFEFKGQLCMMAAFKQHCSFRFWKGALFLPKGEGEDEGMGQFGKIASLKDLPGDKVLLGYIKKACELNEAGIKVPAAPKPAKRAPLEIPADLGAALKKNAKASATFEGFSYSHKKEYVQWIAEAKRPETRQARVATTLEWLAEGKPRHWKYQKC